MAGPDDWLPLSGIQHFCFCRRQWALIHLEQQWAENRRTVEGQLDLFDEVESEAAKETAPEPDVEEEYCTEICGHS